MKKKYKILKMVDMKEKLKTVNQKEKELYIVKMVIDMKEILKMVK